MTLKRMSVSFRPEEEGECSLKVLSFMSVIDRRLSELRFFFFTSHYKDQDGLECIKPWRVKMEFSR